MYRDMGFKRIILGREASLDDIRRIKDKVPEMELEAFVHGAMCMSYSGRCMLSSRKKRQQRRLLPYLQMELQDVCP